MAMGLTTVTAMNIHSMGKPSTGTNGIDHDIGLKMMSANTFMRPTSTATGVSKSGSTMRSRSRPEAAVPVQ